MFDIIAEKYADKQQVKLQCIQKIKDYFRVEKMQFNQPIYRSQLEYELMGVEGVRSIGHVTITQTHDELPINTYTYSYTPGEGGVDIDGNNETDGAFLDVSGDNGEGTAGYGYKYEFTIATLEPDGIIRPPISGTPTVFELKNPNQNIQGRVR